MKTKENYGHTYENEQQGYTARIISQHHTIYRAECGGKTLEARVCGKLNHAAKQYSDFPCVGDYVLLDRENDSQGEAMILSILPRKSLLTRAKPGSSQNAQTIAANLDCLFICMSCNRDYNIARLERYLSAANGAGVEPIVVLTKSDLTDEAEALAAQLSAAHPGLRIITCSSMEHSGTQPIREILAEGVTAAFVGSSGVGKSTLINELLGEERMNTSAIREIDSRGRHTTTHRQLMPLPCGGAIIDTPGMRTLSLDESDVGGTFEQIEELGLRCRFGDCTHTNEPGCAIRAALADGTLDERLWRSYEKLREEERRRRARPKRACKN